MATDFQIILRNVNQLPEDVYVNTLYFESGGLQTDGGIADDIALAYTNLQAASGGGFSGSIGSMTIKGYEPGPNINGPKFERDYAFDPAGGAGPAEVALCLSYYAGANQPRTRGRIYLGPFASGVMDERPPAVLRNAVLAFASDISGAGGVDALWQQVSKTTGARSDVTNWWVDNAWDTQRRRGAAPTGRLTGS